MREGFCVTFGAFVHVVRRLEPGSHLGLAGGAHWERSCRMHRGLPSNGHALQEQTDSKFTISCFQLVK